MKEKFLLLLLLKQFINNHKKPRKNRIRKLILQRKRFFGSESLNVESLITDLRAKRRVWTLWNDLAIRQQFRADFRMTPDTFSDIATLVRNRLEKQDTRFREAVPKEKRVAIVLWRFATENSYRSVSKTFAVGNSTAVSITKSFCPEIRCLSKYFIKFPRTPSGTAKAIATFKETTNCKIPQAVGAMDDVHITILSPHTDSKLD